MLRFAAVALALLVLMVGHWYGGRAASGADVAGYLSQAELWRTSTLKIRQPWVTQAPWPSARQTFLPLGFRVSPDEREPWTIVPTYAAGLPLIMAAAKTIAGQCGVFWISPIAGAVLVLATFGLGCRLGSAGAGLIGAWLIATSPTVLHMLMLPMSDVPVAAAWTVAFYCILGGRVSSAIAAGLAAGLAILIRPNLVAGGAVIGIWLIAQWWTAATVERSTRRWRLIAFGAGAASGAIATACINQYLYGSPLRSGYTGMVEVFVWSHFWPNVRLYGTWLIQTQTVAVLAGVAAIALPLRGLWPRTADRSVFAMFAAFVGSVLVVYFTYLKFDGWSFLRFLLPAFPFVMLGLGAVLLAAVRRRASLWRAAAIAVALALGGFGLDQAHRRGVFTLWQAEWRYVAAARLVAASTGASSVIFTRQHAGSLRYYTGRLPLYFENLDNDWLDRSVAWFTARGVHAYALLEDWEVPAFERQFAGQQTLAHLSQAPVFVYEGAARIKLFDLKATRAPTEPFDFISETYDRMRCEPPAPDFATASPLKR